MSACGGMGVLFKSDGARSHTQYQDWNQSPEWGLDFFSRVHQGMKLGGRCSEMHKPQAEHHYIGV